MTLGALTFLNPWLLAALASLPVIYWLLRTVPPRPQEVAFPATRILVGLQSKEKTPAKTPWWLLLIRLLAAALVIAALAEPILNPTRETGLQGTGPVVIAVDNGWAAAARFAQRTALIDRFISEAEAQRRPVVLLATASPAKTVAAKLEAPQDARATAAALIAQPFAPDRIAAVTALEASLAAAKGQASLIWLTDGIDETGDAGAFAVRLAKLGTLSVVDAKSAEAGLGVAAGVGVKGKLEAQVMRAETTGPRDGVLHALSIRSQRLGEAVFRLPAGSASTTVTFDLPLELRNQVARVELAGERSAGAVSLLDTRSQWHRIGLISGENREQAQALLAPLYYIEKALAPFAEMIKPKDSNIAVNVDQSLKEQVSILMMADIGTLSGDAHDRIDAWVQKGGVLVRFAGPRLEKGGDDLMPVPLRLGGRTLGGALSWSTPQSLAPFEDQSLFAGLTIPPDVSINRQVLADPGRIGQNVKVWARLADGTPLVTAVQRGKGELVLFHITANSDWSNLPLSGLFVDMLRRISTLGKSAGAIGDASVNATPDSTTQPAETVLPPVQTLDGYGALKPPPPTAQPIAAATAATVTASLDHPPGYYGSAGAPRAINVLTEKSTLRPLPALAPGIERRGYDGATATPLKASLLAIALGLLFADVLAVIILSMGGLRLATRRAAPAAGALIAFALFIASGSDAFAQAVQRKSSTATAPVPTATMPPNDTTAMRATGKVTFGYVLTGDRDTDGVSRIGLSGLGHFLALKTAVEPGEPMGINIATDEIAFYPVLYWPVLADAQALPEAALARIDAYMKEGGLIIFDTRDYGQGGGGGLSPGGRTGSALQRLLARLDVPRLEPVPETHVLTKSFYLLRSFPGRWDGGQLWVEAADEDDSGGQARKARRADGVTSIMITSNDFAAAWALDDRNRGLFALVPGGEMQRDMAFRVGVNIVMHALTGNYKADQVHVPALLERLGQ